MFWGSELKPQKVVCCSLSCIKTDKANLISSLMELVKKGIFWSGWEGGGEVKKKSLNQSQTKLTVRGVGWGVNTYNQPDHKIPFIYEFP